MKKVTFITIYLLVFNALTIFSQTNFQQGYIVKPHNDTIQGTIDYQNWSKNPYKIRFIKKGEIEPQVYTVHDIIAFTVSDAKYISRIIKVDSSSSDLKSLSTTSLAQNRVDTVFLHVLLKGRSSLYLYKDDDRSHFFMEEDTIKLTELLSKDYFVETNKFSNKKQFKGQLKYYWRNYPNLYNQINALNYDEKSLMRIFERYEKLYDKQFYIEKPNKGVNFNFQLVAGLSLTKLTYILSPNNSTTPIEIIFKPALSPVFGTALEIIPYKQIASKKINHWSIYNEMLYKRYAFETTKNEYFLDQLETTNTYQLDLSYLRLSSSFRYQTTGENFKVYGGVGFSGSYLLKANRNLLYHKRYTFNTSNFTETNKPAIEFLQKIELGYLGSIGIKFKKLSLETRYESSLGMSARTDLIYTSVKHLYVICGYSF